MNVLKPLIILFVITGHRAESQELSRETVDSIKENLVMELNATLFIPGETLFIALRATTGTVSNVTYVEVVSSENQAVLRQKVSLEKGLGSAGIYLPSYLKTGSYHVVAYTNWMRNFGQSQFPGRMIQVVNPFEVLPSDLFKGSVAREVNAHFLPESGYFVPDAEQRVGFQVTDQFGEGLPCKGRVINEQGEVCSAFSSDQMGSGTFYFTPKSGHSYQVLIIDEAGKTHFFKLKESVPGTLLVRVREMQNAFILEPDTIPPDTRLEVWSSGSKVRTEQLSGQVTLQKQSLPKGLLTFSILDKSGREFYRRSVFHAPVRRRIDLNLEKTKYGNRELVRLRISPDDPEGLKNLTLSVRQKVSGENGDCLPKLHYMGSHSATQWPPEQWPGLDQVVTADTNHHQESRSGELELPDLRGDVIQGVVQDKQNRPLPNRHVSFSIPTADWRLYSSRTNTAGAFHIIAPPIPSRGPGVFYIENSSNEEVHFSIEDPYLQSYKPVLLPRVALDSALEDWLLRKSLSVQIENAYYKVKERVDTWSDDFWIHRIPSQTYRLDDYTRFPSLEDVITEYVEEVWIRRDKVKPYFLLPYIENKSQPVDTALVLLNGIPVPPEFILDLDQTIIEKIDVYQKQLKIGYWEYRGIINFQTFEKDFGRINFPSNYRQFNYQPVQPYQTFNSPDHGHNQSTRIPDFRTQLYWEAHVHSRDTTIEFYTADTDGTFEIVLSGLPDPDSYVFESLEFDVNE